MKEDLLKSLDPMSNKQKKIAFEVFESFIELLDLTIGVIPMHTCHPSRNA